MNKLIMQELGRKSRDIDIVGPGGQIKLYNDSQLEPVKNVPTKNLYGDVYWEGWIKYFHYTTEEKVDKPSQFYDNPEFFTQQPLADKYMENDALGRRLSIPDRNSFWAKLLATGNIDILTSRDGENTPLAHTIENLNTNLIGYVIPTDNASGAVKDLGTFLEGSCLSVSTNRKETPRGNEQIKDPFNPRTDQGNKETWVICTKEQTDKDALMQYLISLKIKRQKDIDDELVEVSRNFTVAQILVPTPTGPVVDRYNGPDKSPYDGYWMLLSDWSECSLKCGGGVSIQQWVCIPPTGTGKPCVGDAIRKKTCNLQKCPGVETDEGVQPIQANATSVMLAPIYKALPFSNRPQQYVQCMIKENDVLYKTTEYDPAGKKAIKIPGRIVMNTNTISVFKDDSYNTALFTFNLDNTIFSKSSADNCCFFLTNADRRFEVCSFSNNCDVLSKAKGTTSQSSSTASAATNNDYRPLPKSNGSEPGPVSTKSWADLWGRDFDFFKQKCKENLGVKNLDQKFENRAAPIKRRASSGVALDTSAMDPMNTLTEAQKEIVESRKNTIQQEVQSTVQKQIDDKVKGAEKVSLIALRREINFEDLIKNEEIQKGKEEVVQLTQQVQQEKKKKKVLEQALQMREKTFETARTNKETEKQVDNIKTQVQNEIQFKRGELKKKISEIRKKYKRKTRQLEQQIQQIRSELANEIMTANKLGDNKNCLDIRKDVEKIKTYCDNAFVAEYSKNLSCKEPDNFCYSCCENEFGTMYMSNRDECFNACDQSEKVDLEDGDWVWTGSSADTPQNPPPASP